MTSLTEMKNWFKTGFKPTQMQFWLSWDSFWHKEEIIPQANILYLETDLENKANLKGENTFTDKQTIQGDLELKGNVKPGFEWYSSFGGPETGNMYFDSINPTPEYPEFDGLFFFALDPGSFDENIQSETITVRLSVDDHSGNYVFTKNDHFAVTTGYGPTWTMPALTGYTSIYLDGATVHRIAPNAVKLNLPADTDDMGGFLYDNVVRVQPDGTLRAAAPGIPDIDSILAASGNTINADVDFRTNDNHNRNQVNGEGSLIAYNANDGSGNDRFASYTLNGVRFESHYNNPSCRYAVSVIPNMAQGNSNPAEVVLPKKSGHLPVKSELPALIHRTIATTAATLTDSQLNTLITPLDNSGGDYRALHTTLVYNGTANATWAIPAESFNSYRYTIINNTGHSITINRVGITTFWVAGVSNTSVTIPANGWAEIIGSEKENRFYFRIF
ncbi:hypothetical protein [Flavobacterium sp. UBA4197]|uniref:hypothetical protein n=1 Tax=Flavobacterium sp. UBA4197 TaxID=1946546 RepID=UPI00257FEF69|nr:hypothetical protein [Flavobacterium sp. UBA4197]